MAPPPSPPPPPPPPLTKPPPQLCTLLFFLLLCILGLYALHYPPSSSATPHLQPPSHYHSLFLSSSSNSTIASYLRRLTLRPHLAGTPSSDSATDFVRSHFQSLNLDTRTADYQALASYPSRASLAAHFLNGTTRLFPLAEEGAPPGVVIPYHAYSPSGSARARVVFVNHGREEDYRALAALGVEVNGTVVLARKGGEMSRAGVVQVAESRGALAVLMYGEGDRFGVERGTVMRGGVGDPLTPGWAAVLDGGERLSLNDAKVAERFPKIPSLPVSFENAALILASLGGPACPPEWTTKGGSLSGRRVGPGPTVVNLTYQGEKKVARIHNVFAVIGGLEEPDRYVILGNHRDAWTYGAVDPNSGTAALLDIARRFTALMQAGWKPRRTIIFSSWDAEEFGMVGSTEWVEQNLINLGAKAVAYLNVDCAVQGPGFFAGATPQLDDLLLEITKQVKDPDSVDATVYEMLSSTNQGITIQRLSAVDSDFAPFLQHAGIPSVDIYYGRDFPVYHTAFDSYEWMRNNADPQFHRHVAVAGIWGLLALRLADDFILPFNYLSYANQLQRHKDVLNSLLDRQVSCHPLETSIQELAVAAKEAEDEAKQLRDVARRGRFVDLELRALNDRLMLAERGFLDTDGLEGRQWFKHLIYGPPGDYESKLDFFPGIADAISGNLNASRSDQLGAIQHEIWRVARAIERAARALRGKFP
ncbi:putative glutamate carboxypeptidase amp1 [Turnera subulata]|uniref:glutamate carboxypeptidase II n=1 Tax=Turnera subulata TaxID=218843 RepID=A0A9Q0JIP1_9ROSI|nr:putative glutamate carboxypeptidase amp1 [Turnera subulata]